MTPWQVKSAVEQPSDLLAVSFDPRDRELVEGLKVAAIALGIACLVSLLTISTFLFP